MRKLLVPALVVLFPSASILNAEDWLQWRGAGRANLSAETGLYTQWGEDGPPLAWMAEGLGSWYASVTVAGDHAYTSGNFADSQSALAIDTHTG